MKNASIGGCTSPSEATAVEADLILISVAELTDRQIDQMGQRDLIDVVRMATESEPESALVQILELCDLVTLRRIARASQITCRERIGWSELQQRLHPNPAHW